MEIFLAKIQLWTQPQKSRVDAHKLPVFLRNTMSFAVYIYGIAVAALQLSIFLRIDGYLKLQWLRAGNCGNAANFEPAIGGSATMER